MRHTTESPWQRYHRAVGAAKAARARLFGQVMYRVARDLKRRVCWRAKRWHLPICANCC